MAAASKLFPFPQAVGPKSPLSVTSPLSVRSQSKTCVKIWLICMILMVSVYVNVETSPVGRKTEHRIVLDAPNVTSSSSRLLSSVGSERSRHRDQSPPSSRRHGNRTATTSNLPGSNVGLLENHVVLSSAVGDVADVDEQVHCVELRSKRYISDGFCRTIKPITEVVCVGFCLPARAQPHYFQYMRDWAPRKGLLTSGNTANSNASSTFDFEGQPHPVRHSNRRGGGSAGSRMFGSRCINGVVKNQRVRLVCDNGDTKVYTVPVVKNCICSSEIGSADADHGRSRTHHRHHHGGTSIDSVQERPSEPGMPSAASNSMLPVDSSADVRRARVSANEGIREKRRKRLAETNDKEPQQSP